MSKKTKHTPGPWRVIGPTKTSGWGLCIGCAHNIVARLTGRGSNETSANARLIAAAPDLLAVLKEVAESSQYWGEYDVPLGIHERIAAAIAKAEGEQ